MGAPEPRTGTLTRRQRLWAWVGFLATALQAPLAAHLTQDASWLFSHARRYVGSGLGR
jgi:hypothetical protein